VSHSPLCHSLTLTHWRIHHNYSIQCKLLEYDETADRNVSKGTIANCNLNCVFKRSAASMLGSWVILKGASLRGRPLLLLLLLVFVFNGIFFWRNVAGDSWEHLMLVNAQVQQIRGRQVFPGLEHLRALNAHRFPAILHSSLLFPFWPFVVVGN
jgi:hypothetical protein